MKNEDEIIDDSKIEKSRREREERLKALRDKEAAAKRNRKVSRSSKRNKILISIVTTLLVLVGVTYLLWVFGIPQRILPAIKVNDQTLKITDYNYNYFSFYSQYNQAFGTGVGLMDVNQSASAVAGEDITWKEFFDREAKKGLQQDTILYKKAIEAGYSLDEEDQKEIDAMMENFQKQVGTPLDYELYLESMYGRGMNKKEFRRIAERQYLAMKFANEAPNSYEISAEDIDAKYEEDKSYYDIVTYHSFSLITPTKKNDEEALTQEEIDAAVEENQKKAEEIVEEIESDKDVEKVARKHAAEADKEVYDAEGDQTEHKNKNQASLQNSQEVREWLFDDERKEGDKTFIKVGNNFEILYFVERQKDTRKTADFMISAFALVDQTGIPLTDDEISKIEKAAKGMTNLFTSEKDVIAYDEKEVKDDTPKANPSAKYENVDASNEHKLHPDIINFALSEEAKVNKASIVNTENYLYVVTILEKHDKESWYQQLENSLKASAYSDDFKAWSESEEYKINEVAPGFWFTKILR